mmetsp:Transcript_2520/g.7560  ORF Transcript_2520/g.7560 Transcript_2520/m.7560 type:complete len:221 (-) Transcript_2520:179-841(-)
MGQDDAGALALALQCHTRGVATECCDVLLNPPQRILLVVQPQVPADVELLVALKPAEDSQTEVKVHKDRRVLGGLRDAIALAQGFLTRAVLEHAAVEVNHHRHIRVVTTRHPDVQVQAVLPLRHICVAPNTTRPVLCPVQYLGNPGFLGNRLGKSLRGLNVRDLLENVTPILLDPPDGTAPRQDCGPIRRVVHTRGHLQVSVLSYTNSRLHRGRGVSKAA